MKGRSQSSSSPVKAGQGKGGHIDIEKTPQFAEWGRGKPGERRFGKDGYIYIWADDRFGWVKTDKYDVADLNKPWEQTTYWIRNNPDGTFDILTTPPDRQDGKGKGKGKGKGNGKNFIDAYGDYLVAAADVVTTIIPLVI